MRSTVSQALPCGSDRARCPACRGFVRAARAAHARRTRRRRSCASRPSSIPTAPRCGNLGREREGSGIVIDESGLVLTIGYLMVEAHAAEVITNAGRTVPATVVGYDHETGFGLLRTLEPLKIKPLAFGTSAGRQGAGSGAGGELRRRRHGAAGPRREPPRVHRQLGIPGRRARSSRAPPHPAWSGAALINREGKLVGVGSLIVGDANGENDASARQHVRADRSADADPRRPARQGPRRRAGQAVARRQRAGECTAGCWSAASRRAVRREKAGIKRGDVIVGVNGEKTRTLSELLSQGLGARRGRRDRAARRRVGERAAPHRRASRSTGSITLKLQSTF